ncbi:MAG: hypothetical protein WA948_04225 [Pontixanthobacter sp.]
MFKGFIQIAYIAYCAFLLFVAVRYFEWPNDWSWFQIEELVFIGLSLPSVFAFLIGGKISHIILLVCSASFAALGIWALTDMILQTTSPKNAYVASAEEIALTSVLFLIPLAMLMAEINTWRLSKAE